MALPYLTGGWKTKVWDVVEKEPHPSLMTLSGRPIIRPQDMALWPDPARLAWHRRFHAAPYADAMVPYAGCFGSVK